MNQCPVKKYILHSRPAPAVPSIIFKHLLENFKATGCCWLLSIVLFLHSNALVYGTNGIVTVAGNGNYGFSGDGGLATNAKLSYPYAVATDASGNFYIADTDNCRVRKVSSSGIITTVAGNGSCGYSGDGGSATAAKIYYPYGVAVDGAGNLYIADLYSYRVRKVSTSGIITTVAGNGSYGFSGDGGPATSAKLTYAYGVAVDGAGNLYIADIYNYRVRKVSTSGIITTVAGSGSYGFSGDGGPAVSAKLYYPQGVAVDAAGNLYIADSGNHRVRKVDSAGIITTVAGSGNGGFSGDGSSAVSARLYYPQGVVVDAAGNLYIADSSNYRVRRVSSSGIITTIAGNGSYIYSGDGGPATSASFYYPASISVDGSGNLYIADPYSHRIRRVSEMSVPLDSRADNIVTNQPLLNSDVVELYDYNIPVGSVGMGETIKIRADASPPAASAGVKLVGGAVDIVLGSAKTEFNRSVTFAFTVNMEAVRSKLAGKNSTAVKIAYYNGAQWVVVPNSELVDNKIRFTVSHLTKFAVVIAEPPTDSSKILVYPNPFDQSNTGHVNAGITFDGLTAHAKVSIYDVSGSLVKNLSPSAGSSAVSWDVKNEDNIEVGIGLYIFVVTDSAGTTTTGKIAVNRQ